jgi:hypothetical protein
LSTCVYSASGFELYSTYSVTGNNQVLLESTAVTVTMTFFAKKKLKRHTVTMINYETTSCSILQQYKPLKSHQPAILGRNM